MNENKSVERNGKLQMKFVLSLVVFLAIVIFCVAVIISISYRQTLEEYYSKTAFDQTKTVSELIDGDAIVQYANTLEKDEYYNYIEDYLRYIKKTLELEYLYVVIPYEDKMIYIWDAGESGESGICDLGDTDVYYENGKAVMLEAFHNPNAEDTILITYSDQYGYIASAYSAILDSSGTPVALASVDISMIKINTEIADVVIKVIFVITVAVILFVIVFFIWIKKGVISPILHLKAVLGKVADGNLEVEATVKTGDELQDLSHSTNLMVKELREYIDNLAHITADKERIATELNVATKIQASMLPCIFPAFPERDDLDIFATMLPAKEVGGDFYDFFLIDENKIGLVIADVSGKGVPAALFMVIAKTLIKNFAQLELTPGEILTRANEQLCQNNDADMFVTVFLTIIDLKTGEMTYANAGHNPPLIKRKDGEYEWLKTRPGLVLAGMEGIRYREGTDKLEKGDKLYLYTDGVTEATNIHNELFSDPHLLACANKYKDCGVEQFLLNIKKEVDIFVGNAPQFDDITMLAFELRGDTE